jgi:hypothetical protein
LKAVSYLLSYPYQRFEHCPLRVLLPSCLPAAPTLLALAAGLWQGLEAAAPAGQSSDINPLHLIGGSKRHPGLARRVSSSASEGRENGEAGTSTDGGGGEATAADGAVSGQQLQQQAGAGGRSVLLMGVASDGRVWQWQLPLLGGTLADAKPPVPPPAPKPELVGLLRTLPQRVTSFCACPVPVALPGTAAGGTVTVVAAGTAAGSIELAAVQQGALLPLHMGINTSLAAHPSPVLVSGGWGLC